MLKLTWNFEQMLRTLESAPKRYATPPDGKTFTMDVSTSSMETATTELKRQYEEHVKATPVVQSGLKSCSACNRESASKTCGRCRDAWYCSPECQRTHWAQHKRVCKEKK